LGFSIIFLPGLGLTTSNFASRWSLPRPITKITRRKKGGHGPGLGEIPNIWGFSFNIYIMAEASDFEFGTQLGLAKAHHKTTPRRKVGVALGYGSSQIFGVSGCYFCNGRVGILE